MFGYLYGNPREFVKENGYWPQVSIVIATYNEEKLIKEKIENIRSLNYPADKLEIVFVDSSSDGTLEAIEDFKKSSNLKVKVLREETRRGLANALNLGYSEALGEIVIKSDCDILLSEDSVAEVVKVFADSKTGAVTGTVVIVTEANREKGYRSIVEKLKVAETNLDSTYSFNPFCGFRSALIEPIDERSVADDAELALKIRKKGFKTVYNGAAVAYEKSPVSLSSRLNQKSRRAQGHIRLLFQNLGVLFNRKYGKFGTVIFPANFFMIAISPWLFLCSAILGVFYLFFALGPLMSILANAVWIVGVLLIYVSSRPKVIAGFLEAQFSLLVGFFKLIAKGPSYMWKVERSD